MKPHKTKPPRFPNPTITKSYDQNLNDFALWYEEHCESYCNYYSWLPTCTKENIKEKFIQELEKKFADPDRIKRVLETSERLQASFATQLANSIIKKV